MSDPRTAIGLPAPCDNAYFLTAGGDDFLVFGGLKFGNRYSPLVVVL